MNKAILILSLSNLDREQVSYYENLVNEIKQIYANKIERYIEYLMCFNKNISIIKTL